MSKRKFVLLLVVLMGVARLGIDCFPEPDLTLSGLLPV